MGVGEGVENSMLVHQTYLRTHVKSAARASLTVHRNICSGTIDTGIPLVLPSAQGPSTLGYLWFSHLLRDHRHWDTSGFTIFSLSSQGPSALGSSVSPICSGTIDIGIPLVLPSAQGPSTLGSSVSPICSGIIDIGIPMVLPSAQGPSTLGYLWFFHLLRDHRHWDPFDSPTCS